MLPRKTQSQHLRNLPPSPPADDVLLAKTLNFNQEVSLERDAETTYTPTSSVLSHGLHVLRVEAHALKELAHLYETDNVAQERFSNAVQAITQARDFKAKLVITGVGKSGHIGRKLVATFQSLGIPAVFLHPVEALHGDLGVVGPLDPVLIITFSGKTAEILQLLTRFVLPIE
jgi:DNA-binding MurR/RpiR family transcriptional regulator